MAPKSREPALRVDDTVSVAVRSFGEEYARSRAAGTGQNWASDNLRDEGKVIEISQDRQYLVDFGDGEERNWWQRKNLRFVTRPETSRKRRRVNVNDSGSEQGAESNSEQEEGGAELSMTACSDEDGEEAGEEGDEEEPESVDGWVRDDVNPNDERAKWGFYAFSEPVWNVQSNLPADQETTEFFFKLVQSWLDLV